MCVGVDHDGWPDQVQSDCNKRENGPVELHVGVVDRLHAGVVDVVLHGMTSLLMSALNK